MSTDEKMASNTELAQLMVMARQAAYMTQHDPDLFAGSQAKVVDSGQALDFNVYSGEHINRLICSAASVETSRLRVVGMIPTQVWFVEHGEFGSYTALRNQVNSDVAASASDLDRTNSKHPMHIARAALAHMHTVMVKEQTPIIRSRSTRLQTDDGSSISQLNACVYGPKDGNEVFLELVFSSGYALTGIQVEDWRRILHSYTRR
jgi:hypothetical protein